MSSRTIAMAAAGLSGVNPGNHLIQVYNPTANTVGPWVEVDGNNNIYQALSQGIGTSALVKLAKYDPNGNVLWKKQITGLASPVSMCLDSSGNVLLCLLNNPSLYILQYSSSGTLLQQKLISGFVDLTSNEIKVDSSGNVYLIGRDKPIGYASYVGYILKLSANLSSVLWLRFFGNGTLTDAISNLYGLNFDSSGNVYAVGAWSGTAIPSGNRSAWALCKYSPSGSLLLQGRYSNDTADQRFQSASKIVLDSSGNMYVTGVTHSASVIRYSIAKLNSSGVCQWGYHFSLDAIASSQFNKSIAIGGDGYLYISRSKNYNISWSKIATSGTLQFSRELASIGTDDFTNMLRLDNTGSVYVAGRTNTTTPRQSIILKVPQDGTKTGTYSGYTYQSSSPTYSGSGLSQESFSQASSDGTSLISISNAAGTEQTNTNTISTITI